MIEYQVKPDKQVYKPRELVKIGFTMTNKTTFDMTFTSFPPVFMIQGLRVPFGFRSGQGGENVTLAPGESHTYVLQWDQRVTSGTGSWAVPGIYYVESEELQVVMDYKYPSTQRTPMPLTRFVIQHPLGDVAKNLGINRVLTLNGLQVILENIEFSALETKIKIFVRPPDYVPATPIFFSKVYEAVASYRVDNGEPIRLGTGARGWRDTGATISWSDLDPVAIGTAKVSLVIDTVIAKERINSDRVVDKWNGPWVFEIPME